MKFFYVATIFALTGLSANAQILTQSNHAPAAGDISAVYQCDSIGVTPGASGAGAMWNFSTITSHTNILKTYTTNATSNPAYPGSDLVQFSSGTDASYYKSSATELKYYGGAISVSTVVANLTYTSSAPAIRGVYPMSLSTSSSSPISGTIDFTLSGIPISATFNGSSHVVADGTGSLSLPGGAAGMFNNVMRVVTSQTLNFSVAFPPTTGTLTQRSYDYYSVGVKVPLLTISTSTIVNSAIGSPTQTLVFMQKDYLNPALGLKGNAEKAVEISVYPNPASTLINFKTEIPSVKEVLIYDITGKLIDRQAFADGKIKLDISSYNNGFYLYKAVNAVGESLKTGKIAVNH